MEEKFEYNRDLIRKEDRLENTVEIRTPENLDCMFEFTKVIHVDDESNNENIIIISAVHKECLDEPQGFKFLFKSGKRIEEEDASIFRTGHNMEGDEIDSYIYKCAIRGDSEKLELLANEEIDIYGMGYGSEIRMELNDSQKRDIQGYARAIIEAK